jgi:hypothetical protein
LAAPNVLAAACLLAWTVLLGTPLLDPHGRLLGTVTLAELRSLAGAWAAARGAAAWGGLQALRFAPLGLLAVLTIPDREGRLSRAVRVAAPAAVVALALGWASLAARAGFSPPGPFELLLPASGILLGVWAGLAWRRGWWSRLLFLPKLATLGAALLLAGLVVVLVALDTEPAVPEAPAITSAEKRHLVSLFRGRDPRRIPPGETRTVRLSAQELDKLVAWAAAVGSRARTAVSLRPGGVSGTVTVRVPRTGRWLNVTASTLLGIEKGRLSIAQPILRVGRLTVPLFLLDAMTPFLVSGFQGDRDLRRVLPAVESLSLGPGEAVLTYGRADMPRGLIARLVWGEEAGEAMREAVHAQVDRLLEVLPAVPRGDARFGRALESAFALARARSALGSAVDENRAALLALGVVLGHPRLARAVGGKLDEERSDQVERVREGTTLRGRDDRAGTTFADVATRDETSALAMQERLARGFRLDDFFPRADGLPEGIPDTELQSRYGGVGGPLYRRQAEEIEHRVSACAAYRD